MARRRFHAATLFRNLSAYMNELPSVALTEQFLRLCEQYGSQRLAVKIVAVGRDTGEAGLPPSDDWTSWDAHEMRAAVQYLRRKHADR